MRDVQFLCFQQQQQRSAWEAVELQKYQEREAASVVGGEAVPRYHLLGDLWESVYLASSTAAIKMAEFCVRTCCRLLMPDARYCIKIWCVLLKQVVSDKTAREEGQSRLYISTLQLSAGSLW